VTAANANSSSGWAQTSCNLYQFETSMGLANYHITAQDVPLKQPASDC